MTEGTEDGNPCVRSPGGGAATTTQIARVSARPRKRASASAGTAFKAPTFNDLYYPGFSNPDLKPETARNAELALRYASGALAAGTLAFAEDAHAAAEGADALLVLTDWEEFAVLDTARLRRALRYPVVVDGRNIFDPARMAADGFYYSSVGRPHTAPRRGRNLKLKQARFSSCMPVASLNGG